MNSYTEVIVRCIIFAMTLLGLNKFITLIFNRFGLFSYIIKKFEPNPVPKYIIFIITFIVVIPAYLVSRAITKKVFNNG